MVGGLPAERPGGDVEGVGADAADIHTARYLSDPVYRRKISRQLNRGGSLHALRRDLHLAQQGTIVRDQTEQVWCLTLLTNAVITWTAEYCGKAIGELRAQDTLARVLDATGGAPRLTRANAKRERPSRTTTPGPSGRVRRTTPVWRCTPLRSARPPDQASPGERAG
ncbi:MAG TPA: Tn3 family transposase [Nonomuraea sp.]|nr:Tn3 family transposase [Nonomuraea sp.]